MKTNLHKRMMASALSLLLVAATATSFVVKDRVQADNATAQAAITELKILKKLKLPKGVQTPNKEFTFKFTKLSFNGKTEETEKAKLPQLNDVKITYQTTDSLDTNKESIDKVGNLSLAGVTWPSAGQYTYHVKEDTVSNDTTDANYEGIYTASKAEYDISFMVIDDGTSKKVASIYLKRTVADGNDTTAQQENAKVQYNPNPGPGEENGFRFTNIYNKKAKKIEDGPVTDEDKFKKGLFLKKTVPAGTSELFKNQSFRFKITVTKPSTVTSDVNDIKFGLSDNSSSDNNKYAPDTIEFNLKADQMAALSNIWLGSTVTVEEIDAKGAASATITGSAGNTAITADTGNQFKTMTFTLTENGNSVQFENKEQTPTGVLLDLLPFIILAVLAMGGIYYFKRSHSHRA